MHRHPQQILLVVLVLAAVSVLLPGPAAFADTSEPVRLFLPAIFKPAYPDLTLVAAADAYVSEGNPISNYGMAASLLAGNDLPYPPVPARGVLRSLIWFDLPANIATPVRQATLRVYYFASWDYPSLPRTVTIEASKGIWLESAVTWKTQPERHAGVFGSVTVNSDEERGYRDIDVTALVQQWFDGSLTNYGLYLIGPEVSGSDASYRIFLSRESTSTADPYPPELIVKF